MKRYLTKDEAWPERIQAKEAFVSCLSLKLNHYGELNDNVLKEENVLLKDTIAQKEAKLLRSELKLKLSKEELKLDVEDSFKPREEHMKNGLRRDIESANLKINLLQAKHWLEIYLIYLTNTIYIR